MGFRSLTTPRPTVHVVTDKQAVCYIHSILFDSGFDIVENLKNDGRAFPRGGHIPNRPKSARKEKGPPETRPFLVNVFRLDNAIVSTPFSEFEASVAIVRCSQ